VALGTRPEISAKHLRVDQRRLRTTIAPAAPHIGFAARAVDRLDLTLDYG